MPLTDSLPTFPTAKPSKWGLPGAQTSAKPSKWGLPQHSSGIVQQSDTIKAMQDAILKLDLVMHGHEAFNAFLIHRYLNGAKLDGMGAVGKVDKDGRSQGADGSWGTRTDIGLKEVGQLAVALVKVQNDLHPPIDKFDTSALISLIPASYKEATNDVAAKLTEQINYLIGYYGEIADFITKRYGNYLDENTAVVQYKGTSLTPDQQDYAAKHEDEVVITMQNGTPVKLKDIASTQAFAEFLHSNTTPGDPVPNPQIQARWLLNQLGASYGRY